MNNHSSIHHHQPDQPVESWKSKTISQQVTYPDQEAYAHELSKLRLLPPVVTPSEMKTFKQTLENVYQGKAFIIQVGDCAERFDDCTTEAVHKKILFYDMLGNLFTEITKMPTVVIGRMAGQFAKPRSEPFEIVDGKKILNFRGENINGRHHDDRTPDPKRLTEGYLKSVGAMECIRQVEGKELPLPMHFTENLHTMKNDSENAVDYSTLTPKTKSTINRDIFVSHEALILDYEDALIRKDEDKLYALSAHFLWIGMRTNSKEGAHVDFFRGLENPLGVKLSKDVASSPETLHNFIQLIRELNPTNAEGKLVLITRFGSRYAEDVLPKVLKAIQQEDLKVLWVVDGVHGNTQTVKQCKTRKFEDVRKEITDTIKVLKEHGARLNGIHLELTPDEVTECLGGRYQEVTEADLGRVYTSLCDPRLNFSQSVELVTDVAKELVQ